MPATSQAQYRAMQAAAGGKSTLGIPKSVGQEFAAATPSPSRLPRRATSGKPGAAHLGKLTAAHGKGNFAEAKTHALNYAKAVHQHLQGMGNGPGEPDADAGAAETYTSTPQPKVTQSAAPPQTPPMSNPQPNPQRAMLAALAIKRRLANG